VTAQARFNSRTITSVCVCCDQHTQHSAPKIPLTRTFACTHPCPAAGWLHDERALNAGRGVYVAYPCTYVAAIEMPESLSKYAAPVPTFIAFV
jgi:hypothetical protein